MSAPDGGRQASEPETIRVAAVHVAGVRTIAPGQRDLELRFSENGLQILSTATGAAVGRLGWDEIRALKLPRARRGLRRRGPAQLVIATDRGRATFELSGLTPEQVAEHLAPMLARVPGARISD